MPAWPCSKGLGIHEIIYLWVDNAPARWILHHSVFFTLAPEVAAVPLVHLHCRDAHDPPGGAKRSSLPVSFASPVQLGCLCPALSFANLRPVAADAQKRQVPQQVARLHWSSRFGLWRAKLAELGPPDLSTMVQSADPAGIVLLWSISCFHQGAPIGSVEARLLPFWAHETNDVGVSSYLNWLDRSLHAIMPAMAAGWL